MFLKRIEINGFKSFADRTVIEFENPVTGVVGPNGCGKSNISDAIKWVLGEQSNKSLRAEKSTDIIFAGSESHKACSVAEVTLVFDNSSRKLNADMDNIEVTRRIYENQEEVESEYLINKQRVRLKDIQELILDSGIGKDSLSMVSQGNISSFAEAKPYDRRAIFEEAAGVAKYKKRKTESLNRLERTKDNLDRVKDSLIEQERQVLPLKRQAEKALIYREKKERLEKIEVAVLVDEIDKCNLQKDEFDKQLFDLNNALSMHRTVIEVSESANSDSKLNLRDMDRQISKLQDRLVSTLNEIKVLETRKVEIDEKRKYIIEMGSSENKLKELKAQLDNARFEYEDRLKRLNDLNKAKELLDTNLDEVAIRLLEASQKKEESKNLTYNLEKRISVLEDILKDPFNSGAQSGVRSVMNNKANFNGVMGVVGQELIPEKGYEYAISSALGSSIYNIVCKDEKSARDCISFLKRNQSGRATFLPLTVLREHEIRYQDEEICKQLKGYLGIAGDFINCKQEYDRVADSLLNNIIIADTLENANDIASAMKFNYKVVTLDGDVVNKGGSMTGGRVKNEISIVTAKSELERCKESYMSAKAQSELDLKAYNELIGLKSSLEARLTEKRINIAQIEPVVDVKRAKYESLKANYETIAPSESESEENFSDDLVKQLSKCYSDKDELTTSLKLLKDDRLKLSNEIDRKDTQLRQMRMQTDEDNRAILNLTSKKATVEANLKNHLERLSSAYGVTYEYAYENLRIELSGGEKEEVVSLRNQILSLGNVNMSAPEEYERLKERYEFVKKNYEDLVKSRDKILDAIDEMDKIMKEQFKNTFDAINKELNNTFKVLFGGGKAKLVLEDENDILNTGIDIDVQPPGKSIKSIRLFSGGEKTLIAMCVLFTIMKVNPTPLVIFDEVEAALDQANVERFAKYVKSFAEKSQFIIITHRPGTMEQCDILYGITMQHRGVSQLLKVKLVDAIEMADSSKESE